MLFIVAVVVVVFITVGDVVLTIEDIVAVVLPVTVVETEMELLSF